MDKVCLTHLVHQDEIEDSDDSSTETDDLTVEETTDSEDDNDSFAAAAIVELTHNKDNDMSLDM